MTDINVKGKQFAVTGGSGFVGRRLVEMLVQRGAKRVVTMDIREPITKSNPKMNMLSKEEETRVEYLITDISNYQQVENAFQGVDAVFHIAAAVGPFLPQPVYNKVNIVGTQNVVDACKKMGIKKLVASSTPSIFFDGHNISGKKTSQMPIMEPGHFLATYAESKAVAEKIVRQANNPPTFMTINVAPHQVYGPRDALFLPNFIMAKDKLRIFGNGKNKVSTCHVDNYCHGLICGLDALQPDNTGVLGNFYLITDDEPQNLWEMVDSAIVRNGAVSLYDKFRVPSFVMYSIAYVAQFVGWVVGIKFRISPFNVTMLTIDRYFNIEDSIKDLKYKPIKKFAQGWEETLQWFQENEQFSKDCAAQSLNGGVHGAKKN